MASERDPSTSLRTGITHDDFARLLDGFLDGELDAPSLRTMALHATHCRPCGEELEHAEKLSAAIVGAVEGEAARLDASGLWARLESELAPVPIRSRAQRFRELLRRWATPVPVLAAGAVAAALIALSLLPSAEVVVSEPLADNHAQIERIASSAPHVAVWSEPAAHTTAIWVASYEEP
jgi:anti-sigma factor RsiW